MRRALVVILTAVLMAAVVLGIYFIPQYIQTNISGNIDSDTTWIGTVNFTDDVIVASDVRLTILPGAIVNLNDNTLYIDGSLAAKGNAFQMILFNASSVGNMYFSASSTPWDEQAGSGCIMDNCVSTCYIVINGSSPKFTDCILNGTQSNSRVMLIDGGAPIITNNVITGNLQPGKRGGWAGDSNILLRSDSYATITGNVIQNGAVWGSYKLCDDGFYWYCGDSA